MTHNVTYGSEVWGFVVSLLITDNLLVLLACNSEVTLQDISKHKPNYFLSLSIIHFISNG